MWPMKYIGGGWQYHVYDLENGRVLKRYRNYLSALVKIAPSYPYRREPFHRIFRWPGFQRRKAEQGIAAVKVGRLDLSLCGNPTFLGGLDHEQEKLTPMYTLLPLLGLAEGKSVIEEFVALSKRLISQGVMEDSFSLGTNFGRNAAGAMVIMDIGDLAVGHEQIAKRTGMRPWTRGYVQAAIPENLRDYFVARLDAAFLTDSKRMA